jgi:hypothetical protein
MPEYNSVDSLVLIQKVRHDPMANQEQALIVDGWELRLANDHLFITSQSDPTKQVQLSPQAAFALLDYLSNRRDALYWATYQGERDEPEHDHERLHPHADEEDPGF